MTGCVNQHAIKQPNVLTNTDSREQTLKTLSQWRIAGKIAFIQTDKRESANLHWSVDQEAQQQSLRMTTYLGINVLSLEQENELTTIEVDGESYQGDDLELLVWRLTGFTLPTKAIQYWIKGIPFLPSDSIETNEQNLPVILSSEYDNQAWTVRYQQYKTIKGHQLATKMTIKQDQLTIKLAINRWEF